MDKIPFQNPLNMQVNQEVIKVLREWLITQPHLPQVITDIHLQMFYDLREPSIEDTKYLIDTHFTMKTKCREFFTERDPVRNLDQLQNIFFYEFESHSVPEHLVVLSRFKSSNLKHFDLVGAIKSFLIYLDYVNSLQHKTPKGLVIVIDMNQITKDHFPSKKCNLDYVKKCVRFIEEGLTLTVKGIHIINTKPFIKEILDLIRPALHARFVKIIYLHTHPNDMAHMVSMETFPKEYGGQSRISIVAESELLLTEVIGEQSCEWFRCEETLRVDESKRPPPVEEEAKGEQAEAMDTRSDEPSSSCAGSSKLEELD